MGAIANRFNDAFRDYATSGISASGEHEPVKSDIRSIGAIIETRVDQVEYNAAAATSALESDLEAQIDLVESIATVGIKWTNEIIRVRSTGNVALATDLENGDTLNGVVLATNDFVFLGSQTDPAENGLYVIPASGTATRADFANSAAELARIGFMVSDGVVGAGERFTLPLDAADITIGSTALNFARVGKEVSVASEVAAARGAFDNLGDRIDDLDERVDVTQRTEAAIGRAALYGITGETDGRLFGAESLELDFVANYYRYGFEPVGDSFDEIPGYAFVRASVATAYDSLGQLIPFASEEPRITDLGLLVEPARTNKVAIYNANPQEAVGATSVAGITATGLTLTVIDDTAALAAAGLSQVCTSGKAIRVVNGSGSTQWVEISGSSGNGNPHACSAYMRTTTPFTNIVMQMVGAPTPPANSLTTAYQRFTNVLDPASAQQFWIRVPVGETIIFTLAQMEEGDYSTAPIVTVGAPGDRLADRPILTNLAYQDCTVLVEAAYMNAASDIGIGGRAIMAMTSDSLVQRALMINTTGGAIHAIIELDGVATGEVVSSGIAQKGQLQKIALRIASDNLRIARNGGLGELDAEADMPPVLTTLGIGCTTANEAHGSIRIQRLTIIPFGMTDDRLITLAGGTAPTGMGNEWRLAKSNAEFSTRDSARTFMLGGRLHLANGFEMGGVAIKDIWRSSDGLNFELVNGAPPYEDWSAVTALGSDIYAIGATEMWKSTDGGLNFTKIVDPMPFSLETDSPVIVTSSGKLLAFPGSGLSPDTDNGVWEFDPSDDSWTQIYTAAWGPRTLATAVEFGGDLYLLGGLDKTTANVPPEAGYTDWTTLNDLWRSPDDGVTWTQVVANMPSGRRIWPSLVVFEGRLYMMGGYDNLNPVSQNYNDTWVTEDGVNWTRLETSTDYPERHAANAYVMNGRMYLAAGKANLVEATQNDIWQYSA